jgi:3-dehydroquinate synthase
VLGKKPGLQIDRVVLPDGEQHKDMATMMKVLDHALEYKLDRKSTFVALGGGVIGDMVGFAAAIYQRGVNFVQVRARCGRAAMEGFL